jgi:hypothetical protein
MQGVQLAVHSINVFPELKTIAFIRCLPETWDAEERQRRWRKYKDKLDKSRFYQGYMAMERLGFKVPELRLVFGCACLTCHIS